MSKISLKEEKKRMYSVKKLMTFVIPVILIISIAAIAVAVTEITYTGELNETGIYNLSACAEDNAGNSACASAISKVDLNDPAITDYYDYDSVWINSAQTINLIADDLGSGIAFVRYCEGAACSPSTVLDSPYHLPFNSDVDKTIRYQAEDSAGRMSDIGSIDVKIDLTAPSVPIITPLDAWNTNGIVNLQWAASDASISGLDRYEVWRADEPAGGVQSSYAKVSEDLQILAFDDTGLGTDTKYYYKIKVYDNAGNSEESSVASTTVDTENPGVQVAAPDNNQIFNVNSVTVTADYSNTYLVNCQAKIDSDSFVDMNNDNQVSGTADYTFTGISEGMHDFTVKCSDEAGNSAEDYAEDVIVDTVNPIASLTVSPTGCTNYNAVDFTPTCTDATSGISSCTTYANYDNNGWTEISAEQGMQTYIMAEDGTYEFKTIAVDNAAWTDESSISAAIRDIQIPSTNAVLSGTIGGDDWYASDVTVTVTASNGICPVTTYYCRYTEPDTDCTPSLISTPYNDILGEGINHIKYYSKDTAGNIENEQTQEIKIDKTAPTTTDDNANNNIWTSFNETTVTLTAYDELSLVKKTEYSINDGALQAYSAPLPFYADGVYVLKYFSTDNANNQETPQKQTTIKLDASKPTVNITVTPKSWAECAANGWFFWLIWFVDSGETLEYPLAHGCNEVNAVINADISGLQGYTINLYGDDPNVSVATSTDSGLDFNFDTSRMSYRAVVEATDNANNYATESLTIYEDDDEDYVPDILDLCPTIRPAEGMDVNPKDGCPDVPGVPGTQFEKCVAIYTGSALTSLYPTDVMNEFGDSFNQYGKLWFNFNSSIASSTLNVSSAINVKVEDNTVTICSFDLKALDSLLENYYKWCDSHHKEWEHECGYWKYHKQCSFKPVEKDIRIREENKTNNYNLQETWKLDLSDGAKIRANVNYNDDRDQTKIHLTYENHKKERLCDDSCNDEKKVCMAGIMSCYDACSDTMKGCLNGVESCNDQCESAQRTCVNQCGKNSQCKKNCYNTAESCRRGCDSQRKVCYSNAEVCRQPCNAQMKVCHDADKACEDVCRDTYNFYMHETYPGIKTLSLYDIMTLIGYV